MVSALSVAAGIGRFDHDLGGLLRGRCVNGRGRQIVGNGGRVFETVRRELVELQFVQAERGELSDDRVGQVVGVELVVLFVRDVDDVAVRPDAAWIAVAGLEQRPES